MLGDESATFEIEVDVSGFDDQMSKVEARAERAAKAQTRAADREAKKQAAIIAGSILAWKKLFDFMETGTGPASAKVRQLSATVDDLKKKLAEATAQAVLPMVSALQSMTQALGGSTVAVSALGQAYVAGMSPMVAFFNYWSNMQRVMAGGLSAGEEGAYRTQLGITGTALATAPTPLGGILAIGRGIGGAVSNVASGLRSRVATAAQRGQESQAFAEQRKQEELASIAAQTRRGGGGGGRGAASDPIWQRYQREQEVSQQIARLREQEADAAVAATQRGIEESHRQSEAMLDDRHDMFEASIEAQMAFEERREELDRAGTEAAMERVAQLRQAWVQMGQATMQVVLTNLLASGSFDKAARAGLSALGTMAAFRALFEGAEAIAALVTPGMQGFAAGHAKAAAMFGAVAVGTAVAGKIAFGGNYGRGSNGSRGGGGDLLGGGGLASPRSNASGGVQKVEQTFIIKTSGDMLDSDRSLRRLARHVRDLGRRGYDQ